MNAFNNFCSFLDLLACRFNFFSWFSYFLRIILFLINNLFFFFLFFSNSLLLLLLLLLLCLSFIAITLALIAVGNCLTLGGSNSLFNGRISCVDHWTIGSDSLLSASCLLLGNFLIGFWLHFMLRLQFLTNFRIIWLNSLNNSLNNLCNPGLLHSTVISLSWEFLIGSPELSKMGQRLFGDRDWLAENKPGDYI